MLVFFKRLYSFVFYKTAFGEILTNAYSFLLHLNFSFKDPNPGFERKRLEYYLVKHCHIVEKGLALPAPRKGFGQPKIIDLIKRTKEYEGKYQVNSIGLMVRDTLREYLNFHKADLICFSQEFISKLNEFIDEEKISGKGGVLNFKKSEVPGVEAKEFENFLKCRHSVRNFSSVPVDDELIFKAIDFSRNTPSVCNRQGWFVHYFNDKLKIKELLSFQNGNAGFTDSIDKLLIVTCTTKAFTRYEHNQLFIDGGLYSMNVMLSLHALGLGSCPLNTCMPWLAENRIKNRAGIDKDERLIMMIAVGNLLDEFSVAQSEKYPVENIIKVH